MRVVEHWPKLPREVVDATSLEPSKVRLDKAVSSLVQLNMSLLTAGRVAFEGSSQPKLFYSLMKTLSSMPGYEQCRLF